MSEALGPPEFRVQLHPQQLEVFTDPHRFKVVVAGRRWGKSRLALYNLLIKGLESKDSDVYYIAPTFEQGKRIMWRLLKKIGRFGEQEPLIEWAHENTGVCRLINGIQIHISGSDNPDTIRGVSMKYAVLDEYASMKPMVWEEIVRPALMDTEGQALFIGTPAGKNHFFDLYKKALEDAEWACFQFKSRDNPFLKTSEIDKAFGSLSRQIARQELEASFESFDAGIFREDWIKYGTEPEDGEWYIAIDLAGFEETTKKRGRAGGKLDETAVWGVKVHEKGWFLGECEHGRWDIRETVVKILRMSQKLHARCLGIESGALKNAVMPYLEDQMRKLGHFPRIEAMTHGGKSKADRVIWALQGRFDKGLITLKKASWNRPFIDQLLDFPNPLAHDDLVDSLAYIAQIAVTPYFQETEDDFNYEPLDLVAGY